MLALKLKAKHVKIKRLFVHARMLYANKGGEALGKSLEFPQIQLSSLCRSQMLPINVATIEVLFLRRSVVEMPVSALTGTDMAVNRTLPTILTVPCCAGIRCACVAFVINSPCNNNNCEAMRAIFLIVMFRS